MKSFGEIIKKAREDKNYILRHVGAELDIDQAIISKFERGERKPTKEQVIKFATFFGINQNELLIAWLSDKVVYDLENESLAEEALKVAEEKIQYIKSHGNG
jgi:transcriptional regulator with XRE-family HTH domain